MRPEKLTKTVRRQLENPANELSFIHFDLGGKLPLKVPFSQWLQQALQTAPIKEAPLNFTVATAASGIRLPQSDFGDVFLAATASVLDLTLVTSDQQLIECEWIRTLAN